MAYKKLSEQVQELSNPQRSDLFVKQFREAVREGKFDATFLTERFTMPKTFSRRGAEGTYQRDTRDMLFDVTPDFEAWFEETNEALAQTRRTGNVKPTAENIAAGLVDFKALAEETRRKMQASYEKGQALGKGRSRTSSGGGASKTRSRKK
ncbi:hypothetical protein F8S09_10015 [Deinococcus sp. SDU3-2]|uniref:Uncharacterized protein n=1 Tax=Deinococcus terrestris TaxID=2651870 RepID=A0A7X1NWC6_9DEIO|nr:hypothetical protein [Deinococcus terrestris]MPY67020.1 hypothetical protein [Deinococcus terrestris]